MRTLIPHKLLLAALILIESASCKKTEIIPPVQEIAVSTAAQQPSSEAAITHNDQIDIDLTAPGWNEINSCTGEQLKITSGIWHIVMHGMYSDHAYMVSVHNNIQDYKLVSLVTGLEYTGNSTWNGHYNFPLSNPNSFTLAITNSVILSTPGGGNNSRLNVDLHMTVDPNGNLNVSVDNFGAGCQ